MIKLVYCITRKPGMSAEEFRRTWLDDHAPLVASYAAALGAAGYVQSHTRDDPANTALQAGRGMEPAYDGITELWWEDREAFERAMTSPEAIEAGAALVKDEARFIDFSRSRLFLTDEHRIF